MRFFKSNNRDHPAHILPTVLWDGEKQQAVFEFKRAPSGLLEFETDDPALIDMLQSAGYGYEAEPGVPAPPTAPPHGGFELTEETKKAFSKRRIS